MLARVYKGLSSARCALTRVYKGLQRGSSTAIYVGLMGFFACLSQQQSKLKMLWEVGKQAFLMVSASAKKVFLNLICLSQHYCAVYRTNA